MTTTTADYVPQDPADGEDAFGTCPDCGHSDGYLNIGKAHWFYCATHKTCWVAGWNLFSTWQDETEADQRAAYEALDFGSFTYVATTQAEADQYAAHAPGRPARVR